MLIQRRKVLRQSLAIFMAVTLSTACRERVAVDTVRAEFGRIPAPREARLLDRVVRPTNRSVSAEYATALSRAAIANHYTTVMPRAGWTPCGETELRDWGRDLGDREYNFSKGGLIATVFVPGERGRYQYSYSIYMGPADRYPWEEPGCRQ